MADQEEDELRMALRMSLYSPPEAKRSKPAAGDTPTPTSISVQEEESPEAKARKLQRELMAAAAERRILRSTTTTAQTEKKSVDADVSKRALAPPPPVIIEREKVKAEDRESEGKELSSADANQLFSMVFGNAVSREILTQWTNQGIRFSSDPGTCMGLVQHEGGPCGVLATIQAFVLKYLLFFPDELGKNTASFLSPSLDPSRLSQRECVTLGNFGSITEDRKARALIQGMVEILFMCGSKKRAVIATLSIPGQGVEGPADTQNDEIILKALEGLQFDSASDLKKILRVNTYTTQKNAFHQLKEVLPVFRSRFGAMLFLISALLSRGLDSVQLDRDDPSLPLVTAPFGHASQEIVNLLLCGQAVPNVFDGRMDLEGGMFLKGIPTSVEVGFLTLLESLNFCKVGQHLKCPKWPIWVVGSESHYTVLFAFDTRVQDENELEEREKQIRQAFDVQDQSGGGGFISVEGLHQVLRETNISLPLEKLEHLCSMGFIVWSEFWQVLLDLDRGLGGLKDSTGLMGRKLFDLYHFNGIAKSVVNGSQAAVAGESPMQRPRLSKLKVSVPPRWTPEEFMADVVPSTTSGDRDGPSGKDTVVEMTQPDPQHAPLVDCIRTRWPRAVCNWVGDPPSIV